MRINLFLFFFSFHLVVFAQNEVDRDTVRIESDSVKVNSTRKKISIPMKRAIYSAFVPGLGQVANKKYWKLPILYGGAFTLGYLWINNASGYWRFKREIERYKGIEDPDVYYYDPVLQYTYTSVSQLKVERDKYRKYRDYAIVGSIALYVLNIMDAYVDAHLTTFDVSNDLAIRVQPEWNNTLIPCLVLSFDLK
ncbi:MAG: DUF5683 domain-containing protein [Cytophagaceae bacterium]|nr:DUF5683 domain-containing protein [Cytophagaceae bacterium]MDW8455200.1 DUF5683 domain-containing protein [Cytophagaceae bacterium]